MTETAAADESERNAAVRLVARLFLLLFAGYLLWLVGGFAAQLYRDHQTAERLEGVCASVADVSSAADVQRQLARAAEDDERLRFLDSREGKGPRFSDSKTKYEVVLRNEPTAYLRARCSFIADGDALQGAPLFRSYWK